MMHFGNGDMENTKEKHKLKHVYTSK